MTLKTFGRRPHGRHLDLIKKSPQYHNNAFRNSSVTRLMEENGSMLKATWKFFNKPKNTVPPAALPSVTTNLKTLPGNKASVVWFGHSSYLLSIHGKNILVDPVFSGYASPFAAFAKSFKGSNVFSADDLPAIDLLIITHDHYDHLDYTTIMQLLPKTKAVCTSLGVSSHLVYWGMEEEKITELDWWQEAHINGIQVTGAPARHFSGRGLTRYKTLWSSFVVQTEGYKIYVGADSGYDTHFATIGSNYGPFDLAILETGQYNEAWRHIHMMPEEAVQATLDLKAKALLPVHWAKFALALHAWDEPVKRVLKEAAIKNVKVTTPLIGEPVMINESYPSQKWWETV
ncbi:MBL fold metallo-hydrolase [Foetidibacter luteolus]|uniref:MBL fold metallo-hydrolase n=1 Tax=Foetidibacter luteolus TaxID=2608880 RepID=UPI00129AE3EB|nr:MBL fold metallo-hydrolase [Foetidibacter luteolus]